jgi:isoleucyl-tRNA synthetase
MFKKVDTRKKYSEMEKEVLKFWKENEIFKKSVEEKSDDKYYSFYDGPPFITGSPHYGTLLSSIVKDCVPRYWTMKGYKIERRWGWDCHGLPAENMVEKKLGVSSKKEIEGGLGIDKFNQECFCATSKIAGEWESIIDRVGRWVEFKNAYKTMDKDYMESVWWAFKELYKKDLVYKDVRVSLYCPRCSTPLSNFEIAMDNSYETDSDPSVFVKMELKNALNPTSKKGEDKKTYFMVWTTTPWTLPANVALAVGKDIKYSLINFKEKEESFILATDKLEMIKEEYEIIKEFKGIDLVGMKYQPIFEHDIKGGYKVIATDFVNTKEGTGIVHLAPAFGEDDFKARKEDNLPMILNVDEEGRFIEGNWKGEKVWEANEKIVAWLKEEDYLFRKESVTHSYPHCHRCHSKLIYKAQPAWFVNVDKIRKDLLKNNEEINWYPDFLKEGRFKKGIESAPDWNISRDRYWGTAMPIWKCEDEKCDQMEVFGSYAELKEASGVELEDYHRPRVDEITFDCKKCGKKMKRIPQVFDCWVESGSMSYAQFHYPFENKEKFEKSFPTDFVSEYIAQTRAWFYVMHVLATGIFNKNAFKNVLTTGTIAGSDGKKMSKSLGNFPNPNNVLENYSADALRFYLLSSPLMNARNIDFSEESIKDVQRKILGTLWNSYGFFVLYAEIDKWEPKKEKKNNNNLLDSWILSELNQLIKEVDENMQKYDLIRATKPISKFIDNLSNWYIRRSRRRFWKSRNDEDKEEAYQTLWLVLTELSKVIAPFCPFVADEIYRNLMGVETHCNTSLRETKESVHLCDFPKANQSIIDMDLNKRMEITRRIIELGLSLRAESGIKVRQPLGNLQFTNNDLEEELLNLIKEEVNVKQIVKDKKPEKNEIIKTKEDKDLIVGLDIEITPELALEGQMRDLVRHIQQTRKEAGFQVDDHIKLYHKGGEKIFIKFGKEIGDEVLADEISLADKKPKKFDLDKKIKVGEEEIEIWLKK